MSSQYTFFTAREIEPCGWLRRQLEIEAAGLAGNLDLIWPDVRDSKWIGGSREGWERVPYWLDGFIPLAYLLRNPSLINRAQRYIEAILARQCPDGWLCPCTMEERPQYDMWALLLLSKVLCVYADCTNDSRIEGVLYSAFRNFSSHIDAHPLSNWGKFRWYEGLIAIKWLYRRRPEEWMLELADKIHAQGFDYPALCDSWPYPDVPETQWTYEAHVVNLAMAIKSGALYNSVKPSARQAELPKRLLGLLRQYHWMPHGHFTGSECLAGSSPIQGSELCSVAEAMYSEEWLLALTGDVEWGDWLEQLAFNAWPATCSPDMWTHQYLQQPNQIGCVVEEKKLWTTNGGEAHTFGLEPNFGCCTANLSQSWPKFALATFMCADDGIFSAVLAPSKVTTRISGAAVSCELRTKYPFRDQLEYVIETAAPVEFTLHIRIPKFAAAATIDGRDVTPGTIAKVRRVWNGQATVKVELQFKTALDDCPAHNLKVLRRGALLFALPIAAQWSPREYTRDDVERKFPYCDYDIRPASEWAYAFAGNDFTVKFADGDAFDVPFDDDNPPIAIEATMAPIDWRTKDGFELICNETPESPKPTGAPTRKTLFPYGCTTLRMTEMPYAKDLF